MRCSGPMTTQISSRPASARHGEHVVEEWPSNRDHGFEPGGGHVGLIGSEWRAGSLGTHARAKAASQHNSLRDRHDTGAAASGLSAHNIGMIRSSTAVLPTATARRAVAVPVRP